MENEIIQSASGLGPEVAGQTEAQIKKLPGKRQALFSVLASAILWSTSFVITKAGVLEIPPLTFGALRFAVAAAVVGMVALILRCVEPVTPKDRLRLGIGGLLGITAYFSLQNLGVQRTSAAEATLLVASYPAITMLLEIIFQKTRVSWIRFTGVGIAFLGIFLVIGQTGFSNEPQRLLGDILILGTGIIWSFYNFVTKDVIQRYTTFTTIFWQTLVGAAAFIPLAFLEHASWQPLTSTGLFSAVFLGIFCSVAAFMLYGFGLKSLDAGSAVGMLNLVPVFGLGFAILLLGDTVNLIQCIGGAIVIIGVTLTIRRER